MLFNIYSLIIIIIIALIIEIPKNLMLIDMLYIFVKSVVIIITIKYYIQVLYDCNKVKAYYDSIFAYNVFTIH